MWRRGELTDCSFSLIVHSRSFLHAMIDWRRREDLNQEENGRLKCSRREYRFFFIRSKTEYVSGPDRIGTETIKGHFHGPTVSVRSGPVDRTSVGLCGTLGTKTKKFSACPSERKIADGGQIATNTFPTGVP